MCLVQNPELHGIYDEKLVFIPTPASDPQAAVCIGFFVYFCGDTYAEAKHMFLF